MFFPELVEFQTENQGFLKKHSALKTSKDHIQKLHYGATILGYSKTELFTQISKFGEIFEYTMYMHLYKRRYENNTSIILAHLRITQ